MNIVETFTGAFTDMASGLGTGITKLFNDVFVTTEGGLSNIAIWGITFGAIGLCLGLVRMFTRKAG